MDKKKTELVITACLIIVFIWAIVNGARTVAKRRQLAQGAHIEKKVVVPQIPQSVGEAKVQQTSGMGRDPFSRQAAVEDLSAGPVTAQEGNIEGIALTGIVYDKEDSAENYCIINNEVVALGESIAGFTLSGIKEDSIVLTDKKEGKDYTISLWGDGS